MCCSDLTNELRGISWFFPREELLQRRCHSCLCLSDIFYFLKEVRTEFEIPHGQGRLGQNLNNDQNDCH